MNKVFQITLLLSGAIIILLGVMMRQGFKESAEIREITHQFRPELVDFTAELTPEQQAFAESCLKSGMMAKGPRGDTACRCLGVNVVHYIVPLLPEGSKTAPARFLDLLQTSDEIGAKTAVLRKLCEDAGKKPPARAE